MKLLNELLIMTGMTLEDEGKKIELGDICARNSECSTGCC